MKNVLNLILALGFLIGTAQAADLLPPDVVISNTTRDVLAIVKQDKDIQAGNQKKILELVDAKVLPQFDFTRMTQLAVGKHWKRATPEQKVSLETEFRNMLVRTYAKAFTVYKNQVVEVKPFKMAADETEVTVKTNIVKAGTPPVTVNYEMRKLPTGWKVFDVSIEGVSMVTSYRGTFDTKVQESGIEGLIKMLVDKNANSGNQASQKADDK